jgi:hypothetical protein
VHRITLISTDIFSALDTLTSRWIIDNLFMGDLMRGRTVLLVVSRAPVVEWRLIAVRLIMSTWSLLCRITSSA